MELYIASQLNDMTQGSESIWRCHLASVGNPIVEIKWSYDHLISTMELPILVRQHIYIESGPRLSQWSYESLISTLGFPILIRQYLYIESGPGLNELMVEYRIISYSRDRQCVGISCGGAISDQKVPVLAYITVESFHRLKWSIETLLRTVKENLGPVLQNKCSVKPLL